MFTRRRLLQSAAALASSPLALSQPAPIAALKNRRGEARPISNEERLARIERARRLMHENKLDAIAMAVGTSLSYFSGVRWGNSERLFLMILPARGEPLFVAPAFEKDRALEQLAAGPFAKSPKVLTWEEDVSPYSVVASALKEYG